GRLTSMPDEVVPQRGERVEVAGKRVERGEGAPHERRVAQRVAPLAPLLAHGKDLLLKQLLEVIAHRGARQGEPVAHGAGRQLALREEQEHDLERGRVAHEADEGEVARREAAGGGALEVAGVAPLVDALQDALPRQRVEMVGGEAVREPHLALHLAGVDAGVARDEGADLLAEAGPVQRGTPTLRSSGHAKRPTAPRSARLKRSSVVSVSPEVPSVKALTKLFSASRVKAAMTQ